MQLRRLGLAALLALALFGGAPAYAQDAAEPAAPRTVDIASHVAEASQRFGLPEHWIYAVMRTESAGRIGAVSSAGAMGLMQLMPGTANEQAGKMGMAYMSASLTTDPQYNIMLGDGYFGRMMDYYGGSYPLAVAAYNAGPGNVNRIIRQNGDPRNGGIDWVEWIERIPISETRNYVQRVIENAVVYEAMNPGRASYRGPNPLSHFLGKRTPG